MSPTDREQRIIDLAREIPPGEVATYGELSPGAPRLAGRVMARVHDQAIPWWRVVRADGSLAAGEEQQRRLEAERVPIRPGATPRVDFRAIDQQRA